MTPANIKGEELFIENFEQDEIPTNYSVYMETGASILLSEEQQYSGQKSLKLLNSNPNFGCNIMFPFNIDYSHGLTFSLYQFFEESEPFYWIGVQGQSNGIEKEIILEYGNPYADWIEETVFLVRGFNIPINEWVKFSANITSDLEQALRHPNRPFDNFTPVKITFFLVALDSTTNQRMIFIDELQSIAGTSNEKNVGITTSLQNFQDTFYRSLIVILILVITISLVRIRYKGS